MKKISIILKDITENGGGERVCVNLANALSKKYNVEILSFYKLNKSISYNIKKEIKIIYLSNIGIKNNIFKIILKTIYRYFLIFKIMLIIKKNNTDILISNDGFFVPFIKIKNIKYIRIWHIKSPNKKKYFLCKFDKLIILSKKEIKKWRNWYKNIEVIPNFLPFIPSENTDHKQKNILSIGRMAQNDEKGFLRLIKIWKIVQQNKKYKNWTLTIVGEGKFKNKIEKEIKENNLENSIILKPFTKEIEKEYLNASIYVMASHWEGFGMVLIESASYQLPSIAFDINTGPSDIIENEKSGFLIEDGNLDDFANKICILIDNENLRKTMGENAKNIVKYKFSKGVVIKKWEKIIN